MRRWWVIVRATVLEMLSEPLAYLLTIGATVTVALMSALHFHSFGEPTRMSRDAGLSALIVFGLLHAIFCTVKVFRREIESGTVQMALAHPLSRGAFFFSKVSGVVAGSLVFGLTLVCVDVITLIGAEVGGFIAAAQNDISLVWGPALVLNATLLLVPLVIAGVLNRFGRFRFTTTATVLTAVLATVLLATAFVWAAFFCRANFPGYRLGEVWSTAWRFLPAAVAAFLPIPLFVLASAALAVRLRDHAASALALTLFALSVPLIGNYYLSDALSKGGSVSWTYVGCAALALMPFGAAFGWLGLLLFEDRDVG